MLGDSLISQALLSARVASSEKQRRVFDEALSARDWKSLANLCNFHDLDPEVDAKLREVQNMAVRVAWLRATARTAEQIEAVLAEDNRVGVAVELASSETLTADMARLLAGRQHPRVAAALVANEAISDNLWAELAPLVVGAWAKSRMSADKAITIWTRLFANVDGLTDTAVVSFLEVGTYDALLAALHVSQTDSSADRKLVAAVLDASADYIVSILDDSPNRDVARTTLFCREGVGTKLLDAATKFNDDVLVDPVVAAAAGRLGKVPDVPSNDRRCAAALWRADRLATYAVPSTEAEVMALLGRDDVLSAATLAMRCETLSLTALEAFARLPSSPGATGASLFVKALEGAAACGDRDRLERVATLFVTSDRSSYTHLVRQVSVEVAEALLNALSAVPNVSQHRYTRLASTLVGTYPQLVGRVPAGVVPAVLQLASHKFTVADDVEAAKAIGQWWSSRFDANPSLEEVFDSVAESAKSHTLDEVWEVVESLAAAT